MQATATHDVTLREVFDDRYRIKRLRSASPATIRLWNVSLKWFDKFLERSATLSDLNDDTVEKFIFFRRNCGVSPATINKDLASILALWRWCHRQRLVEEWPDVQQEKEPERTPVAFSEEEFNRIIRSAARLRGKMRGIDIQRCDWWVALLMVCFDTGERITAVHNLRWDNVDLERGWVLFPAETRKGQRRDNMISISANTVAALKKIQRPIKYVFGRVLKPGSLYTSIKPILEDAGIPLDRRHKFHCIRRTTASHYEAAGGNATKLLGHASRRTTEAYLDPRIVKTTPAHELIFKPSVSWLSINRNTPRSTDADGEGGTGACIPKMENSDGVRTRTPPTGNNDATEGKADDQDTQ